MHLLSTFYTYMVYYTNFILVYFKCLKTDETKINHIHNMYIIYLFVILYPCLQSLGILNCTKHYGLHTVMLTNIEML